MKKALRFCVIAVLCLSALPAQACGRPAAAPPAAVTAAPSSAIPALQDSTAEAAQSSAPEATPTPSPTPTPASSIAPAPPYSEVSLLFTGDIMYYDSTLRMQWDASLGRYDFSSYFEGVEPFLQSADFTIGNLEAPVWNHSKSRTDNWRFAAPPEAVAGLGSAGFDVLTTANNHAMDQGFPALANTIAVIRGDGLLTTGSYRNAGERDAICMLEKNGVKVALFACTSFLNKPQGGGNGMGVDMIDVKRMREDVRRAREAGADAVVFSLHFGTQYTHEPNAYQVSVVKALREAGADAVIGAHPHVLQPFVVDPSGKFFAAYSLGNVVTDQTSRDMQFAALLKLTVRRDNATGMVSIADISYVPTWVRAVAAPGESPKTRVYDLRQALAACEAGTDPRIPSKYLNELKKGMDMEKKVLGEQYMAPTD